MGQSNPISHTTAPLRNVGALMRSVDRAMARADHLPGMITFHGPSGFGKSWASAFAANTWRGIYVEARSTWTRKFLCQAILREMPGVDVRGTIPDLVERIGQWLAEMRRPLIVDEADHIVDRGMIELVRDIYETSRATVILVGEEMLPNKLMRAERVHGRMLDWVAAQPADLSDAQHLARLYCLGLEVADDLLALIMEASGHSVRRIAVNLARLKEAALVDDRDAVDRAWWGDRELFSGRPPARRAA